MSKSLDQLPADPSKLYLHYTTTHGLVEDPYSETLQRWGVSVRHAGANDSDRRPTPKAPHDHADQEIEIGRMEFYRVRLDQGMNGYTAMEEESEELSEIAGALLHPDGYFTTEASERLLYAGTDLLVMDRVVLITPWRGFGLGAVLAAEAINRLAPGCRAVACIPGIADPDGSWRPDQAEWDRVTAKITTGWERVGFTRFRDTVYLLDPATGVLEEQRSHLRSEYLQMCMDWKSTTAPITGGDDE
ncbi:hypothetical protein ACFYZ8_34380 [Streptomyces sp. NPDC001668]|uniref:hypothetical protein n=1 Tax=Streptomyces sp. NPDC001668 TaxID=3364598 RepID=UPI0036B9A87B